MSRLLVATFLVLAATSGFAAGRARRGSPSWAALPRERLALAGLAAQQRDLEDALAPVVSDAAMRQVVVGYLAPRIVALEAARRDLDSSVRARIGVGDDVALVLSDGVAWVATSR